MPKLPKYKKKDGRTLLILTKQNVKLKENILKFPKSFEGFELKLKSCKREDFDTFKQIRFIPGQGYIAADGHLDK